MKTITLRNIPSKLASTIERRASAKGTSINKAVLSFLAEKLGIAQKTPVLHKDLDKLIGCWDREEAAFFETTLTQQRQIDSELWG